MTEVAEAVKTGTEYTVLEYREIEDKDGLVHKVWVEVGVGLGVTKDNAIKAATNDGAGVFKAVPTRSWKGAVKRVPTTGMKTEEIDL